MLKLLQADLNFHPEKQELPITWNTINTALANFGGPSIDYDSFGLRYDSEDPSGPLHNIVNGDRDSFNNYGIRLVPDNQQSDMVNEPSMIDPEHSQVKQMANHALKSK